MFDLYLSGWAKFYIHETLWKRDFWLYKISRAHVNITVA